MMGSQIGMRGIDLTAGAPVFAVFILPTITVETLYSGISERL